MKNLVLFIQLSILLLFMGRSALFAQSGFCQSSALKPVFKQDFGQAASSTSKTQAPPGSTNYTYDNVGTDGHYIVTPRVENANKSDWTKGGDHTGNTNGNMFLVNAGGSNSVFFRDTAYNLCQGSNFNFTAWLANANTSATQSICGSGLVYAKVTFNIKDLAGNILNTVTTGNLPLSPVNGPPNWQQYGFQFSLPTGVTTVVFEMVDFYGGGAQCGNDLMLDDILFTACTPQITANIVGSSTACAGSADSIFSVLINNPYVNPAYQWQMSADGGTTWTNIGSGGTGSNKYVFNTVSALNSGVYRVLVGPDATSLNSQTCVAASNGVPFTVTPTPKVSVTSNSPVCTRSAISLSATASSGTFPYTYVWSGPNNFFSSQANPSKTNTVLADSGYYKIVVSDVNGCKDSATAKVTIIETPVLQALHTKDTVCNYSRTNIQLNSSIAGSYYTWASALIQGSAIGNTNNALPGNISIITDSLINTGTGPARIRYIINAVTLSGCTSNADTVYITVQPSVTPARAGTNQVLCNSSTAALSANIPLSGSGTWQQPSSTSTAVITSPGSNTTTITGLLPDSNYSFVWKITGAAGCPISTDTVKIINRPAITAAKAGNDSVVCDYTSGLKMIPLKASSNPSRGFETGTWRLIKQPGGAFIDNIYSPSANLFINQTGIYVLEWKITNDNNCTPSADTVQFTITQKPASGTISSTATSVCMQGPATFTAGNIIGSLLKWQYKSASLTNNIWKDSLTNTTTFILNNMTDSLFARFIVASVNNACAVYDTSATAIVKADNFTIAGTLKGDSSVCSAGNSGMMKIDNYVGNDIRWEQSFDNLHWNSVANTTDSLRYTNLINTTYFRAFVQNGACTGSFTNTVIISVASPPSKAAAGSNRTVCIQDTLLLNGNNPSTGTGTWTQLEGDSVHFSNTNAYNTGVSNIKAGTYSFKWTISNLACNSSTDSVKIVVNDNARASFHLTTNSVCENTFLDSSMVKVNLNNFNKAYEWYLNDTLIGNSIQFPSTLMKQYADTCVVLLKAISAYGCKNDTALAAIPVLHTANTAFTISDTVGCSPLSLQFHNSTGNSNNYTYQWDLGNQQISTLVQPAGITLSGAVSGLDTIYQVKLTALNACGSFSTGRQVLVKQKPLINFSAQPVTGCSPLTVSFNNNSVRTDAQYIFNNGMGADSLISNICNFNHTFNAGYATVINTKLTAHNSCGTDSVLLPVQIKPNPTIVLIDAIDSAVCGNTVAFFNHSKNAMQFSWDFGDGQQLNTYTTTDTIKHTYTNYGAYKVGIRIVNGCSDTTIFRKVYLYPKPKATFVATAHQCIGDTVMFKNQSDSSYFFTWSFGNGNISNTYNTFTIYKNAGLYYPELLVTKQYDLIVCKDSATIPLQIVAQQQGHFVTADSIGRCTPFTATFIGQNKASVSTQWTFSDGSNALGDTVQHTYHRNGIYTVRMIATNAGGCTYIDSAFVKVAAPTATVNINKNAACVNSNISFNINASNTDTVLWHFGDGDTAISNSYSIVHAYKNAGLYTPVITLKNNYGCNIIQPVSDTVIIDDNKANFGIESKYMCGSTVFNFIDSSKAYFGINNYSWSINNKIVGHQSAYQQTFTQEGMYYVSLKTTSKYGCKDSIKADVPVIIYQVPSATINSIADACKTALVNFESQIQSRDSIFYRLWDLGNGNNSKDSVVTVTYYNAGSYNVKLTVATVNLCYDSAFKALTVHPQPTISVSANQQVCRGNNIVINANGATGFVWKDQNNVVICSNCDSITVAPTANATYEVIGYDQWGCSNIASTSINVIQPFTMNTSLNDSICEGASLKLFASGAASYQWYPANGLSYTDRPVTQATPLQTTTYHVIGKDAFGCFADTSAITIVVGKPTPLNIGRDTMLLSGTIYQFNALTGRNDIKKWAWAGADFNCNNCANPTAKIIDDACISCTVYNTYGCISTDTLCIKTFCPQAEIFVPNAFTPDGDGINDKLVLQGKGIKLVKSFRVFNRWGEMVFERTNFMPGDPAYGWDGSVRGKPASPDVYVYIAEVICEKGYPALFKGNTAILK
ncbi:MAG: PKD domain-containing protein [Sphingobacteriia bacterium]|nr:PKD domain-containing protein [Sphingobacteriia bacterium]